MPLDLHEAKIHAYMDKSTMILKSSDDVRVGGPCDPCDCELVLSRPFGTGTWSIPCSAFEIAKYAQARN